MFDAAFRARYLSGWATSLAPASVALPRREVPYFTLLKELLEYNLYAM